MVCIGENGISELETLPIRVVTVFALDLRV